MLKKLFGIVLTLILLCFGAGVLDGETVMARDYTPSVTVVKTMPDPNSSDETHQVLIPVEGAEFVIEQVNITPTTGHEHVDLTDKTSYSVNEIAASHVLHNLVTGADGKATVSGADNLPQGFYRLTEVGSSAAPIYFVLPYRETDNGEIKDDVVIDLKPDNTGVPGKPEEPQNPGEPQKPEVPEKPDHNTKPNKPVKPGTIIQTSGELGSLPLLLVAGILVSLSAGLIWLLRLQKRLTAKGGRNDE